MRGQRRHRLRMRGDRVHQRGACLVRLRRQRGRIMRRLGDAGEGVAVLGQRRERLRVGHQCRHHLRLSGQSLETRALGERAEVRVMNHELERVGLHQLGHRSVAERDVRFGDLARHITVEPAPRSLHWARAADKRARDRTQQLRTPERRRRTKSSCDYWKRWMSFCAPLTESRRPLCASVNPKSISSPSSESGH